MAVEVLINAYFDANILLLIAYALWSLALILLARFGLRRAYSTHLRLLNSVVLSVAACPLIVWLLGGLSAQYSLNLSDIIVAQYLSGNVEISPSKLETILGLRETFVRELAQQQTPLALTVISIFAIGFAGLSIRLMRNALRLKNLLETCRPWRKFGRLHILLSESALVPFSTRSLSRHYIVIPTVMLDHAADVRIAIGHELQHFRQRDVEWAILLEFLTPVFFWNPVFHLWKRKVTRLREYACDQNLVARPAYDVRAYAECLLRACHRSLRGGENFAVLSPAVPLVNLERAPLECKSSLLRSRIVAMTSDSANWLSPRGFLFLGLPLAITVLLMSLLIQRPADWSHDRLMLSTIVNLERLDALNALSASPDQN